MSKRAFVIAAVGALCVAGAVVAVSAPGHRGGWHGGPMQFGPDDDGRGMRGRFGRALTKDEYDAKARERFARLDRNSDGVIDVAEIEAALAARASSREGRWGKGGAPGQHMLRTFDGNRDGRVTKEESRAEVRRRFTEMDLNGDGKIDDADLPPMLRGRNAIADGAMAGGLRGGGMRGLFWLRQADANKDGVVTREEVEVLADREFARFDLNKDGTIDQADRDLMRKEMTDYRAKRFVHHFGADKDGRVTREQFQAKAAERFARMDLNNDGTISRDERPGRWHGGRGRRHGHGDGMGPGGMMGPGDMGSGSGPQGAATGSEPAKK